MLQSSITGYYGRGSPSPAFQGTPTSVPSSPGVSVGSPPKTSSLGAFTGSFGVTNLVWAIEIGIVALLYFSLPN